MNIQIGCRFSEHRYYVKSSLKYKDTNFPQILNKIGTVDKFFRCEIHCNTNDCRITDINQLIAG